MIRVYLDTSCLAKLFVAETDSEAIHRSVQNASAVATSVVSYVEMMSMFNRRRREGILMPTEYKRSVDVFDADWRRYLKIEVSADQVVQAAKLTKRHPLRALDALQLAAALSINAPNLYFLTADKQLQIAARSEKLRVSIDE